MKTRDVVMVRVYITESSHLLNTMVNHLTKEVQIRGVSVFRAISGFGETGAHVASLMDLSLDLPLVIEFFDVKNKVDLAIDYLNTMVKAEHVVFWDAKVNHS
jgi:PII-like signaling protein